MEANFIKPTKQIKSPLEMPKWEKSQGIQRVLELLEKLNMFAEETQPVQQHQRFGNPAYRQWFAKMSQNSESLVRAVIGDALPEERAIAAASELAVYLEDGFGNATRIDYGTGHELSFLAFLCCLFKIGLLHQETDGVALVTRVFGRYLELARMLQLRYMMEPAGSHGNWSLDDYQFVPFIWGSAQLIDTETPQPKEIPKPETADRNLSQSLFWGAMKHIHTVKKGPFHEHSMKLWEISGVENWRKINQGLIRMYQKEVLSKFPIIQHFFFGSLLTLEPIPGAGPGRGPGLARRPPPAAPTHLPSATAPAAPTPEPPPAPHPASAAAAAEATGGGNAAAPSSTE